MSNFSEKLRQLIAQSGSNVYQAAKNARLDRTTVQKAITGGRLPSTDFIKTLCANLCVSTADMLQLWEFYEIEKLGEKIYTSRKYIKNLLEQFSQWEFIHEQKGTIPLADNFSVSNAMAPFRVLRGQYVVNTYVRTFLESAAASSNQIYVSVPCAYDYFSECLQHICWSLSSDWSVQHLVPLLKTTNSGARLSENLKVLLNVLPLSFCLKKQYDVSCYYCDTGTADDISLQMPYYFFTSTELVTLSQDFKQAVVYSSPELLALYRENFDTCKKKARPLSHVLTTGMDMTQEYASIFDVSSQPIYIIEPQPCFAYCYTPEMVDAHIRYDIENRDAFRMQAVEMYKQYQSAITWPTCFFSAQGIWYFVETGRLADLPEQYTTPFSVLERKALLKNLYDSLSSDTLHYRAVNNANWTISNAMTIQLYSNNSLLFVAEYQETVISCLLCEAQIGAAFHDFFGSLIDTDLVLSKSETLQILTDCMMRVDQMLCDSEK